ncbi:Ig-like domain-containing protein [Vibrio parahaemolyticus]|uniref:Ig-like domain-containing protein n=1 Tax=Vibrio parahaemolyticus TaxID=670 RepID=UPI001EEC56E1|nr:Ig-like domain-containing protein [Vibrio parahaemolyticus]MCG6459578.1 Ig-like domain-containing protein [Vibrio parahaemolyticus]
MMNQSLLRGFALTALSSAVLMGCNSDENSTTSSVQSSNIDHLQVTAVNPPVGETQAGDQVAINFPLQYQAILYYNDGTAPQDVTDNVTWQLDNSMIAVVDAEGVVKGKDAGATTIHADYQGVDSNASPLTVTTATVMNDGLLISGRRATINGVPVPFTATATFSDGTQQDLSQFVTWSSSDTTVADFTHQDSNNTLVASTSGYTDVSANYAPASLTAASVVSEYVMFESDLDSEHPLSLTLKTDGTTMAKGASKTYTVSAKINTTESAPQVAPFNVTPYLTFESSNPDVVKLESVLNRSGEVAIRAIGMAAGTATITATGSFNGTSYTRSGMLTVAEADITAVAVSCDDAHVPAGLDTQCHATATYSSEPEEGVTLDEDITDSVIWSSSNTAVLTASTTGLMTGVTPGNVNIIATTVGGPSGATFGEASITVDEAVILSDLTITNTSPIVYSGETMQLHAQATTTEGASMDVTRRVTWSSSDSATTIDAQGVLTAESGVITDKYLAVTAAVDELSDTKPLIVKQPYVTICGTGVDDSDPTNAARACLKVATDADGNWFASTPSIAVMDALGYTVDDSETNSGKTYSDTEGYHGNGGVFAEFRQDGAIAISPADGGDGANGQFYRWCKDLAAMEFAGKSNWRRPTSDELEGLYAANGNMWDSRGWPTGRYYWSSTVGTDTFNSSGYNIVGLDGGNVNTVIPMNDEYASCVSNPVDDLAILSDLVITNTETSVDTGATLQLHAQATTTQGEAQDVTTRVIWASSDSATTIDSTGLLTAESDLTTDKVITVTATSGELSATYSLTITAESAELLPICGTGVDDTDQYNASGNCLKVATDADGNWFTSTPSITVMDSLGYTVDNSETNAGKTYASAYTDNAYNSPKGEFAAFRQDGIDSDGNAVTNPGEGDDATAGVNGQFDRWCQQLNELEFAGKNTWRRPTKDELYGLADANSYGGMSSEHGWPGRARFHWVSTVSGSRYVYMDLITFYPGGINVADPSADKSASCISNP